MQRQHAAAAAAIQQLKVVIVKRNNNVFIIECLHISQYLATFVDLYNYG